MLKEYRFSAARQSFTTLFDDVQNFIPSLIKARKQSETDGVILNRLLLAEALKPYTFDIDIRLEDDGTYWSWIKPLNDYAMGDTKEDCKRSTAEAAQDFAEDFLNEPYMFQAKNTRTLVPYVLRILLCDSLEDVERLLFGAKNA
ncbi:hypothetical protein [Lentibacillus sp.]|uniref:hypothetical protein n=1 Tax=Lentibacillus sp. TaxID=1925746 RepID=UPI002B4B5E57|nr:hypothetical protein [Lentibacillus sp.]HLS10239.1 hypothetical protein [Lentibacillus sp.]